MRYCFGVDIGGTTVKLGLFKFDGEVIEKWEIKTRTENEGSNILLDVAATIQEHMAQHNLTKEDILGVGVGIPAPVMESGIVKATANLGWGYKEVRHELEDLLEIEVQVGNDANVAALGEMWKGGGLGHRNMIMITLGTGVGGGVITNGRIMVGGHGAGGEIGHVCVNYEETEVCGCGSRGCLEQYASATGIARMARKRLMKNEDATVLRETKLEDISAKTVFDAVKEGDAVACEIANDFGRYLGYALANLAVITDPDIIVIGGGVSRAGEVLLDYVTKYFNERVFFANKDCAFALATLGNDAGIYGAAKLVLK